MVYKGRAFVFYGRDVSSNAITECEMYDFRRGGGSWVSVSTLSLDVRGFSVADLGDGKVLLAGGKNGLGTKLATSYIYDMEEDSWSQTSNDMPFSTSDSCKQRNIREKPWREGEICSLFFLSFQYLRHFPLLFTCKVLYSKAAEFFWNRAFSSTFYGLEIFFQLFVLDLFVACRQRCL